VIRRPPVLVLTLGLLLGACTSSVPAGDDRPKETGTEVDVGDPIAEANEEEPEPERLLPEGVDVVAAPRERYTPMFEEPGAKKADFALDTRNINGELSPMLIVGATPRDGEPWYQVLLPLRPNGTTAWVREGDVKLRERTERIEVDLSKRTLEYLVDGELAERFEVGIGTDQFPTTTGDFYVYVKVPYDNPNQPYGIMALGLSGFSRVITDWPGGGRIAVHGTPYASNRGEAVSHGCVRVYNQDMESLLDVPLGTPVIISE
jgi:lipoprotein-anchoring transpeptidase ErfK/SrfK